MWLRYMLAYCIPHFLSQSLIRLARIQIGHNSLHSRQRALCDLVLLLLWTQISQIYFNMSANHLKLFTLSVALSLTSCTSNDDVSYY